MTTNQERGIEAIKIEIIALYRKYWILLVEQVRDEEHKEYLFNFENNLTPEPFRSAATAEEARCRLNEFVKNIDLLGMD